MGDGRFRNVEQLLGCNAVSVDHLAPLSLFLFCPAPHCSDRNDACCKDCQYEVKGKVCQQPINATCKGKAYCTGEPFTH